MKLWHSIYLVSFLGIASVSESAAIAGTRGNESEISYLDRLPPSTRFTPGTLIVKFKAPYRRYLRKQSVDIASLSTTYLRFGVTRTTQMYPGIEPRFTRNGEIDIARMYRLEYTGSASPIEAAKEFSKLPEVEYAEPEVIHSVSVIPNDPMYAQQWHLPKISAPQAWDITTGDPNVVIGIVDTGVDWLHPDLRPNIFVNPGEDFDKDGKYTTADLNGIDDDNNGYIDDVIGIDLIGKNTSQGSGYYDSDPSPTAGGHTHGTHVAGISAAVGNNGLGVAGVAYSCKILPVKCSSDLGENSITRGYDGIVYAANMGAQIINCSWGGGGYLRSEEERIDYATSKGALVVAAAGNTGRDEDFESPAAYSSVLAVANTNSNDKRNSSSTYGLWVDVSAPGTGILSTISRPANGYVSQSGTSMSSPCVAGVAALVKSHFPAYTPLQVAEQVRVTSDNIDALNPGFAGKLGYGRVNAHNALTLSRPAVRLMNSEVLDMITGNNNGIYDPGETLQVVVEWKNFLAPTSNALVSLTAASPYVTVLKGSFALGQLGTGETVTNSGDPFLVVLKPNIPLNYRTIFTCTITDGSYQDYASFFIFARPTYRDHDRNDIMVTISNDGNLGFDDFTGLRGKGFIYQNNGFNVLFEGALMLGGRIKNEVRVVDQVRDETGGRQNSDFTSSESVVILTPGQTADQEGFATWTDDGAVAADRLGIRTSLHSYEFDKPGERNIVILRYRFTNTSADTIRQFHAGLFFDWDISTSAYDDSASYDDATKTGLQWDISYTNAVPTHCGVTVLTRDKPVHYMAIANPDNGNSPNFGIHDGFTKDEKWLSMSSGILKRATYITDASMTMGNGPYDLNPGDSCEVAFALLAGLTKQEIIDASVKSIEIWERINSTTAVAQIPPDGWRLDQNYPNPFGEGSPTSGSASTTVAFGIPSPSTIRLEVTDILGRRVALIAEGRYDAGSHAVRFDAGALPAGIYFSRLTSGTTTLVRKMVFVR